jgi:hypothetical protein
MKHSFAKAFRCSSLRIGAFDLGFAVSAPAILQTFKSKKATTTVTSGMLVPCIEGFDSSPELDGISAWKDASFSGASNPDSLTDP